MVCDCVIVFRCEHVISEFSCVCVVSAMDDGNCSPWVTRNSRPRRSKCDGFDTFFVNLNIYRFLKK